MAEVLHQRGASGLVAEYQCALTLGLALDRADFECRTSLDKMEVDLDRAIQRVADELSERQLTRARAQGRALGEYVFDRFSNRPEDLGLRIDTSFVSQYSFDIDTVGRLTSSGDSADLIVTLTHGVAEGHRLPISLKAYRGSISSLGSKGARASLCRLFLGLERASDHQFTSFFGQPAIQFIDTVEDFKTAAREFYNSAAGEEFVDAYEQRKGSRKVNNPLRRKEVGDYYAATRGVKSEHVFAELYVKMFTIGTDSFYSADSSDPRWTQFQESLKFVLGMDNDILTLNAVAGDDGVVKYIDNSFLSDVYADIRHALGPGCSFKLQHRKGSSVIGVEVVNSDLRVRCLSLAMWKDATIQFKLDTRVVES